MSNDPRDWDMCDVCDHERTNMTMICRPCLDVAKDAAERRGAAVAFGLMGMAEAIRSRCPVTLPCEDCGEPTRYDRAFCDDCEGLTFRSA